jgi:hypothetical protein
MKVGVRVKCLFLGKRVASVARMQYVTASTRAAVAALNSGFSAAHP